MTLVLDPLARTRRSSILERHVSQTTSETSPHMKAFMEAAFNACEVEWARTQRFSETMLALLRRSTTEQEGQVKTATGRRLLSIAYCCASSGLTLLGVAVLTAAFGQHFGLSAISKTALGYLFAGVGAEGALLAALFGARSKMVQG